MVITRTGENLIVYKAIIISYAYNYSLKNEEWSNILVAFTIFEG